MIIIPVGFDSFSADVELDSVKYTLYIKWNLYSSRWYFELVDTFGYRALTAPLLEELNLLKGFFNNSTMVYKEGNLCVTTI